jgi:hypothetical protein
VTFFAPAKKVTRWREATAEALLLSEEKQRARRWIPAFAGMTSKRRDELERSDNPDGFRLSPE